jgi:hypothetical protein
VSASALRESFSASVVRLPRFEISWIFVLTSMDKRLPSFHFGQELASSAKVNAQ